MAISLNRKAVAHVRSLIEVGKVDAKSPWSFDDAADGNAQLGTDRDNWGAYAAVHLGVNGDANDHTKARYEYPVVKGGKVFASGLRAAITRASQNDAEDVANAARKLLAATKGGEHAGFDDYIEVFQAGKHTDSAGQSRTWSRDDLDQIVANFDGERPAPLVIGHPKTDSPAWGWTSALKRDGAKLLAKFNQVPDAVVDAVRAGRYRNRSVKLSHEADGWKLVHVGLLGAAPPAVEGLAAIAFDAEAQGVTYEFNAMNAVGTSAIARGMQKLRELIIAHFGQDEADRYVPQDDIDHLQSIAGAQRAQPDDDAAPAQPAYSRTPDPDEDSAMDEKLKADLDAATKRATEAEAKLAAFAAHDREASAKAMVESLLAGGKLLPAQAAGLSEFLASESASVTFEFSAGSQTVSKSRSEFLFALLESLPKQIELNQQHAGAEVGVTDAGNADAIVKAAKEFQKAESAKGNEIAWHEAVTHVMKGA